MVAVAIAIPILLSNCATIMSRSAYPVYINSAPEGANITVTDRANREIFKGTAPATVVLKSGASYFTRAEYQVKFTMNGYDERILPIQFKMNGWYFGNILLGGVIGMLIIDPASGAMWKLATPQIYAPLNASHAAAAGPTLRVMDIKDVPESSRKGLVLIR